MSAIRRKEFLTKLRDILDDPNNIDCLRWTGPDTFFISNESLFTNRFLTHPSSFPCASFPLFTAQLVSYGFETAGENTFKGIVPGHTIEPIPQAAPAPAAISQQSTNLADIHAAQASMMNQIETMYHDMEEMNRCLKYLKSQSQEFDALVKEYNERGIGGSLDLGKPVVEADEEQSLPPAYL